MRRDTDGHLPQGKYCPAPGAVIVRGTKNLHLRKCAKLLPNEEENAFHKDTKIVRKTLVEVRRGPSVESTGKPYQKYWSMLSELFKKCSSYFERCARFCSNELRYLGDMKLIVAIKRIHRTFSLTYHKRAVRSATAWQHSQSA